MSRYQYQWGKESSILLHEKNFFSKNLTIRVQEGLQPQAISYLGLDMLKMPKTSKIIFLILTLRSILS